VKAAAAPIGEQTDHTSALQLGGAPEDLRPLRRRRSPKLRIVPQLQLPAEWEARSLASSGAPRTRGDCANVPRPCPYVDCRSHLWLRLQQEQPGNPQAGKQGETTFRPSTMQTCALDVAERGASYEEIGEHLGMDSTRARQIAQAAIEKLQEQHPELAAQLMERL
jgi:hypothetical protein